MVWIHHLTSIPNSFNDSIQKSYRQLAFNYADEDGANIKSLVETIALTEGTLKSYIYIQNRNDRSQYLLLGMTSFTDKTTHGEINATFITKNSVGTAPFPDATGCQIEFAKSGPVGYKGEPGEKGQKR